jgi:hypothetical protein
VYETVSNRKMVIIFIQARSKNEDQMQKETLLASAGKLSEKSVNHRQVSCPSNVRVLVLELLLTERLP